MVCHMRQMKDRHMTNKITFMVWSNKLDLLALANDKGEVSLHRLNWQKIWSLAPPSSNLKVAGVDWRPDGKVLAIGYSNRDVIIVDVENKSQIHKLIHKLAPSMENAKISKIIWTGERGSPVNDPNYVSPFKSDKKPILNPLPKLGDLSANKLRSDLDVDVENDNSPVTTSYINKQTNLNFLFVLFDCGVFSISIYGLISAGVLKLPEEYLVRSFQILSADVSNDLMKMYVLVSVDNILKIVVYNSDVLGYYRKEIHSFSVKQSQINVLMDYMKDTMSALQESYENALLVEMESKVLKYFNESESNRDAVCADFLELQAFGIYSSNLENFFLTELTDKNMKKVTQSIDLSYSSMQKILMENLIGVCTHLNFHLSELKGMARLTVRYQLIGLDEFVITRCFRETSSLLIKASEMIQVLQDSLKSYRTLLKWFHAVTLKLSDERDGARLPELSSSASNFISNYLYNFEVFQNKLHTSLSPTGMYLDDKEFDKPALKKSSSWENLLNENSCLSNHPVIIPRHPKRSLVQQYEILRQQIFSMSSLTEVAIGNTITHVGNATLAEFSNTGIVATMQDNDKFCIALIKEQASDCLKFIEFYMHPGSLISTYVEFKSDNKVFEIVDLQFYNTEEISVLLLQTKNNEKQSLFLQLPIKWIREKRQNRGSGYFVNAIALAAREHGPLRSIDSMIAVKMAVSGPRKVSVVLSESLTKVRTYEMEIEDDEEEEEEEELVEDDPANITGNSDVLADSTNSSIIMEDD